MALPPLEALLVTVVLCAVLSALAYAKSVLTWDGSVAAFAVGLVIGVLGDVTWLLLLLFFLLSSFLATRYRFALEEALGDQEGKHGERGASNALADGGAPPGPEGGVSALGEACALVAAAYTPLFGWLVLGVLAPVFSLPVTMPSGSA